MSSPDALAAPAVTELLAMPTPSNCRIRNRRLRQTDSPLRLRLPACRTEPGCSPPSPHRLCAWVLRSCYESVAHRSRYVKPLESPAPRQTAPTRTDSPQADAPDARSEPPSPAKTSVRRGVR